MSSTVSIKDVAREAEVSVAAVSYTLNGKGDRYRIGRDTQARVRAVALSLGYQANGLARDIRMGNWHPADSTTQTPTIRREVGLVVGTGSPASSLALIPGQVLALAAEGITTVIIALPADGEGARSRLAELFTAAGFLGLVCCPSLFTSVASAVSNQCPLIALSPWAAETLLGKHPAAATRTDTPIPPAAPIQSASTAKPLPVITPVVIAAHTPVVDSKPPPIKVPSPTPVAKPTPTPATIPVVVPEPEPTLTPEAPPPVVVPAPEPPAPTPTPVVVEPVQKPAPAPAPTVIEVEAPPVVTPEPREVESPESNVQSPGPVIIESASIPTPVIPPPEVVPAPEPPAPIPTPVVVEPIQEPAPAPIIVEAETPPVVTPEPVAEVPPPVIVPKPTPEDPPPPS